MLWRQTMLKKVNKTRSEQKTGKYISEKIFIEGRMKERSRKLRNDSWNKNKKYIPKEN